jgi:hypothetical protein
MRGNGMRKQQGGLQETSRGKCMQVCPSRKLPDYSRKSTAANIGRALPVYASQSPEQWQLADIIVKWSW